MQWRAERAERMTRVSHMFSLGQAVRLTSVDLTNRVSPSGTYEITRLMPEDQAGVFSYRLKSETGERVARESELVAADAAD